MTLRRPHASRAGSLVEVTVAMVMIAICVIAGFSAYTLSQRQIFSAVIQTQATQVAQNECERQLSLKYADCASVSTKTVVLGDMSYNVTAAVVEEASATNANVKWKRITVTVNPAATPGTYDDVTMRVVKSP